MQSHSLSGSLLRTRRFYLLVVMSRVYITRKQQGKAGEILEKNTGCPDDNRKSMNCKHQMKNAYHLALVSLPETLDLAWLGVGSGEMALSRPARRSHLSRRTSA
jgi:hypothetical protein